jgi:hypothetical protein
MSDENIQYLIAKLKPLIAKQDTVMRNVITPEALIAATLRFLATGRSFEDLKFATIISPQALVKIIPETCNAIYEALKHEYLTQEKQNFNYRLSRARRCVENAFGVLAARFRIFHTAIHMQTSKVDDFVSFYITSLEGTMGPSIPQVQCWTEKI